MAGRRFDGSGNRSGSRLQAIVDAFPSGIRWGGHTNTVVDKGLTHVQRSPVVPVAFGLLVAVMPFPSSPAFADSEPGCPPGYELRSVASLAAAGNAPVPGLVDRAGNADGYVFAHALPDAVCVAKVHPEPCLVETVYVFNDN